MTRFRIGSSIIAASLFTAGAVALSPSSAQVAAPAQSDEAAIKEIVRRYVEAREARDPKAIEPLLTADADQLVSDGTWRKGRDELVRGMLESSRKTGGRRDITVETVRMLSNDIALADGRYTQTGLAGGRNREMWTTIVLRRGPEGWRIAAIRNMLPAPATRDQSPPEKKNRQTFRYEAEDGVPKDKEAEKRRDYAVLEAALNDLTSPNNPEYKDHIQNVGPRRQIVCDDSIPRFDDFADPGEESRSIDSDHPDTRHIPANLREDLRRRNTGSSHSLADFRPANPDIIIRDLARVFRNADDDVFAASKAFRAQYPNAWGAVFAHWPGYSKDGQSAIVVFDKVPSVHVDLWVYMLMRKGKRWEVQWRHLRYGK